MGYPSNAVDWLTKLIGFNTVSRYSNLQLIEYVAGYCEQLGLSPRLTFNTDNTKANLFVTVPAMGKGDTVTTGGFVFSGHTDVVPVDGQAWATDPFVATIMEDKLYGRGACDMKGFIACALTLLPTVVQASRDRMLNKPIHLALSYDEEVGCLGAPLMLADLKAQGIKPDYCIVGEPTMMKMVTAHKGIQVYRCRVHGKSVHSSLTPQGVNAISYARKLSILLMNLPNNCNNVTTKTWRLMYRFRPCQWALLPAVRRPISCPTCANSPLITVICRT